MAKIKQEKDKVVKSEIKSERILENRALMEKKYGKGSVMGASQKPSFHDYIPTGSIGLDKATGIGGVPRGRIIEIFGPESSGKTTLCLEIIAQAHKNPGSYCAIVDVEHAMDTSYAKSLGVDLNRLEISQPDYGEQALDITEDLINSGDYDVVVVDSVAALVPKAELDGDMGGYNMGNQARLMGQAMRKLTGPVSKTNTVCIFINQLRDKIGVMYGSPETTTGGNALKFYASMRLDVRRSLTAENLVVEEGEKIGSQTTVTVKKNKCSPPFKAAIFDIIWGEGIDEYGEVFTIAKNLGIIEKSGTWFSYRGDSIGQGKLGVITFLKNKENKEIYQNIRAEVINGYSPIEVEPDVEEELKEKAI